MEPYRTLLDTFEVRVREEDGNMALETIRRTLMWTMEDSEHRNNLVGLAFFNFIIFILI